MTYDNILDSCKLTLFPKCCSLYHTPNQLNRQIIQIHK